MIEIQLSLQNINLTKYKNIENLTNFKNIKNFIKNKNFIRNLIKFKISKGSSFLNSIARLIYI